MNNYSVYVKVDLNNNIIDVNSNAFLKDLTEWIKIDEGEGDRYHHAQGNYFEKMAVTSKGICRYKLISGDVVEKNEEEIAEEEAALPIPAPTSLERLEAQILYTATITDTLVEG